MASTYISCLPKYDSWWPKTSFASNTMYLQKDNNAKDYFIRMHLAFKTVIESKLKALNIFIKTAALAFLMIFSEAAVPVLLRKSSTPSNILLYQHRPYYQTLCTLRI